MVYCASSLLTTAEKDLIRSVDCDHPQKNIAANFDLFLQVMPDIRPALAIVKEDETLRMGFVVRGINPDESETVGQHQKHMKDIARLCFSHHKHADDICNIIHVHDKPESITTDLIPRDEIKPDYKATLEYAAVRVIYQCQPDMINYWLDYANKKSLASQIAKDLDVMQLFLKCKEYEKTHPTVDLSEMTDDCLNYRWRTSEGACAFHRMQYDPYKIG